MSTPIERAAEALHRHVSAALATARAGLPTSQALRETTGVAAACEDSLLYEVEHGGPFTLPGLDIAARRALTAALDREEIAQVGHAFDAARLGRNAATWDELTDYAREYYLSAADAVIAHLTGGDR